MFKFFQKISTKITPIHSFNESPFKHTSQPALIFPHCEPHIHYEISEEMITEIFSDILRQWIDDQLKVISLLQQLNSNNQYWDVMQRSLKKSLDKTYDYRFACLETDLEENPHFIVLSHYLSELKDIEKEIFSTLNIIKNYFDLDDYRHFSLWYRHLFYRNTYLIFERLKPYVFFLDMNSVLAIIHIAQTIDDDGKAFNVSFISLIQPYIDRYCTDVTQKMLTWSQRMIQQEVDNSNKKDGGSQEIKIYINDNYLTTLLPEILAEMLSQQILLIKNTHCYTLDIMMRDQFQIIMRLFYEKYAETFEIIQLKQLNPCHSFDYLIFQLGNCAVGFNILPDWIEVKQSIANLQCRIRSRLIRFILEDAIEAFLSIGTQQWLVDEKYLQYITDTFDDYMQETYLPREEILILTRVFFFEFIEMYQKYLPRNQCLSIRYIADYTFLFAYFENHLDSLVLKEYLNCIFEGISLPLSAEKRIRK
jgi:hypothetical protein